MTDDHRDQLPADLDATAVGLYSVPNVNRRRWPGVIYLVGAVVAGGLWVSAGGGGMLVIAVVLALLGVYHLATAWDLKVRETEALIAAVREIGFPVGHASAQLGWQGLRSRPAWRILLYSADDPPSRRGLVLVDGVDGSVLGHFVEDNPEDPAVFA